MFDRLKNFFKKVKKVEEETITLRELHNMATEAGIKTAWLQKYKLDNTYYHFIDNDHNVINEGIHFVMEEQDTIDPKKFEYYVGMQKCKHCDQMILNRHIVNEYKVCYMCLKLLKMDWKKKESNLEEYIDAKLVLKKLSDI